MRSPFLPLLAGAALLLLAAAGLSSLAGPPATLGGPWSLASSAGGTLTDRDLRGRFVLLYFGYTTCPDICPATLAAESQALALLGPRAANLQPVFITVDPAHDTPAILRDYLGAFGPRFIGLTGPAAELFHVEHEWGIRVRRDGRAIAHTSVLLLIAPDGRLEAPLPADESGEALARRLSTLL